MGFSFGELLILGIIALIVIGPKDLPRLLRTAGRTIGTIKRTIAEVRKETGLEDVLRGDFEDLERLADHIEKIGDTPAKGPEQLSFPTIDMEEVKLRREREYPRSGADSMGLLPEDSPVYGDLAADPYLSSDKPRSAPEGVEAAS